MRLRTIRIAALFSILAILFIEGIAGATHYPLTIRDSRGKTVVIRKEPSRIISTVPSNTEILFSLGLGSKIVGVGKWDTYPQEAKRKPRVGDRTISVERVLALKPDLVFAHAKLNADVIPTLERYGIRVVAVDPKTIDEAIHDMLLIGRATNREKAAKTATHRIQAAEAFVRKRLAGSRQHPNVLVAVQADPLFAAGPHTFVDQMIRIAGGINVAANARTGFNQFSAEAAVYRRPNVIIAVTKGDGAVFTRGIWRSTPAVRERRVFEADPDILVRPGPRLANGILEMAKMIHPEVFRKR